MDGKEGGLYDTPWRRMAAVLYRTPIDGRIYGIFNLDVTDVLEFIRHRKSEGVYITVTAILTACLGRIMAFDAPELNCFVHRGRVVPRTEVSVMVAVTQGHGGDMGAIKIHNPQLKTASQITQEIKARANQSRAGVESRAVRNKQLFYRIPWPFRFWAVRLLRWLFVEVGVEVKPLGLNHSAFGSILLTNIGSFGLDYAMPALFPFGKLPAVIAFGEAQDKPVVRDGEIVIRKMIPITATLDHRIVDGALADKIMKSALRLLSQPEKLDHIPKTPEGEGN